MQEQKVENGKLESEARGLRSALEETMRRLRENQNEANMVDRRLIIQLLLNYFKVRGSEKTEVLRAIARLLDFDEEEETAVGLHSVGWFSWLGTRESGAQAAAKVNI